jgi:replicative DNA helicase
MQEQLILSNLLFNEEFTRKVLPHLVEEYFTDPYQKQVFQLAEAYFFKYNLLPTKEVLLMELAKKDSIKEDAFSECEELINSFEPSKDASNQWLIDEAEGFCKKKSLFNAIMSSIKIIDGRDKEQSETAIPAMLTKALGVGFDTKIGHDYFEDAEQRYDYYHKKENRIPLGLHYMDEITGGGIPRKTLNCILGGINVGKTLIMCDFAARYLKQGKNVLYVTMEIAEERIAERIDQNLMSIDNEDLMMSSRDNFLKKIKAVKESTVGRLEIKEYPTATATAANFRYLLEELRAKKNFVPDVIFVDYVNIVASARFKNGSNVNSYTYVKAVAEELRGLMVEYDVVGWTGTQLTREGLSSSDLEMDDVSESIGLPATLDFFIAAISNEDLEKKNHYLMKQLKNRFKNKSKTRRFIMGVNVDQQRLYDVDASEQQGYVDDKPVMDSTPTGEKITKAGKFGKDVFDAFK